MKMVMERWWDGVERGERGALGQKHVACLRYTLKGLKGLSIFSGDFL